MKCRILRILWCCLLLTAYCAQANDVTGCGGFVVSSVNINYSPIKIKLYALAFQPFAIFHHPLSILGTRARVCSSFRLTVLPTMATTLSLLWRVTEITWSRSKALKDGALSRRRCRFTLTARQTFAPSKRTSILCLKDFQFLERSVGSLMIILN